MHRRSPRPSATCWDGPIFGPRSAPARANWYGGTTVGIASRETSTRSTNGLPDMWRNLLAVVIIGYLPGAILFRLPIAERDRRSALAAEERVYWAVVLSLTVTTAAAFALAWLGAYTLERVLICNVALAGMMSIGAG